MLGLTAATSSRTGERQPTLGRTVVAVPVAGRVFIKPAGARRFSLLEAPRLIPVGSTVDTSHGAVKLVSAAATPGHTQYGLFDGGAFVVTQDRSDLTDLRLVGGPSRAKVCGGRSHGRPVARISSSYMRTLHGRGRGHFRTRGSYAAGTVRGTEWTTTDRCEGTQIIDHAGQVATQARSAPLAFPLRPGERIEYRCQRNGQPPVSSAYCVALLSSDTTIEVNGRAYRLLVYTPGLVTNSPDIRHDLCVRGPRRGTECTQYPLTPPDRSGFRYSVVSCLPEQGAGDYAISWRLGGVALGAPLIYHAPAPTPLIGPCEALLGKPFLGRSFSGFASDLKGVNRYTLPSAGMGTKLGIYLAPTGTPGQQVIRGVVYADSGGTVGALVGVTNELTFTSTDAPGWYFVSFPTPLQLSAGSYWIGVLAGAHANVAGFAYDTVAGSRDYNSNAYSLGPSDPFGAASTDGVQMSLYLIYYTQ